MNDLLTRLREETRPQHEAAEALFYTEDLRSGTLSVAQYLHLMQTHLVFHRALENALADVAGYPLEERLKTAWLLADLDAAGEAPSEEIPEELNTWSDTALLGAAYVAEGSMLGGQVIRKWLSAHPELGKLAGNSRFYEGYGSETGSLWKQFRAYLSDRGTGVEDEIVDGAQKAFGVYMEVFRRSTVVA